MAVAIALTVGAFAGSVVTRAFEDRPQAVATSAGATLWDAQKLEAMEGRVRAERFRSGANVVSAPLWDAGKLEAMEGRVLAEEFRATDPITRPHVPKRPPVYAQDQIGDVSASGYRTGGPI